MSQQAEIVGSCMFMNHPVIILLYKKSRSLNFFQFIICYIKQMSEEHDNTKKLKNKNHQPKIHRRKNKQIPKQFFCSVEDCQKAYGSYAALYTHMKNKHKDTKPPNMLATNKIKVTHPGRPKIKKNQDEPDPEGQNYEQNQRIYCKICELSDCQCVENFDSQQKNKVIQIMSCERFRNFTNQVGLLGVQQVNWVRRTEQDYIFKSIEQIYGQILDFNKRYGLQSVPSQKLVQYLSFSSKYWDPKGIDELYTVIYAMIGIQNHQTCIRFVMEGNFFKMKECIKKNPNQFKRLESIIRVL